MVTTQYVTEILKRVAPEVSYTEITKWGRKWHSWYMVDPDNARDDGSRLELPVREGSLEDIDWENETVLSWQLQRKHRFAEIEAPVPEA